MSKKPVRFSLILFASVWAACSDGTQASPPTPPAPPAPSVGEAPENQNFLSLKKGDLGKEFLLQGSMAFQRNYGEHVNNPTSEGLKSRIVVFEEHGDELIMLEANEGYVPGKELPAHALIATFPIIKRPDEATILFDFNKGMSNVLVSSDWYVSDFDGIALKPDVTPFIANSYLRKVDTVQNETIIVQTISLQNGGSLIPVEMTYYLTPYMPNPNYKPVESPGFNYLGFFEANPIVQKDFGSPMTYITRFDISKPITYYLSNAIPEEYRETFKEGVLYWNKAFGKEVLKVEMAPKDVTAPDFKHNVIQWHTDDGVDLGRADAQMDPRTGEILHAQIFFSSAWMNETRFFDLPQYNRKVEENSNLDKPSGLCNLTFQNIFGDGYLYRDVMNALPTERAEAVAKDVVRRVVAHEVGHTLGLRHNFAGSTVGEMSGEAEEEIIKNYLRDGKIPEDPGLPVNSVMDYGLISLRVLAGVLIGKADEPALPYDVYAIQWGYFGFEKDPEFQGHPFCTDSHLDNFHDCDKTDSGRHLIGRRSFDTILSFKKVPWLLSEVYLSAKVAMNPLERKPVKESTPPAKGLAASVIKPWHSLLNFLYEDVKLKSIYDKYPDRTDVDLDDIETETIEWVKSEISHAGGMKNVLKLIDPAEFKKTVDGFSEEFKKILSSDALKTIALPEGGTTRFSEDEIVYMIERSKDLFPEVDDQLVFAVNQSLSQGPLKIIDVAEEFEGIVAKWVEYVLTEGRPAGYPKPTVAAGTPDFKFRYSWATHKEAVKVLTSPGPLPEWFVSYLPAIAEKLRVRLEADLVMKIEEVDLSKYPRQERERIASELSLYLALSPAAPPLPQEEKSKGGNDHKSNGAGALQWMKNILAR